MILFFLDKYTSIRRYFIQKDASLLINLKT